jgi:hypothetical protein
MREKMSDDHVLWISHLRAHAADVCASRQRNEIREQR